MRCFACLSNSLQLAKTSLDKCNQNSAHSRILKILDGVLFRLCIDRRKIYWVVATNRVYSSGQVYANDLNPRSYYYLQENIKLNKVRFASHSLGLSYLLAESAQFTTISYQAIRAVPFPTRSWNYYSIVFMLTGPLPRFWIWQIFIKFLSDVIELKLTWR